jgi:hypothetical protein
MILELFITSDALRWIINYIRFPPSESMCAIESALLLYINSKYMGDTF